MISATAFFSIPLCVATLHELVLKRFEVDHLTLSIIATSGIVYGSLIYATNFGDATTAAAVFWTSLWLYIGTYRAFFHPLKGYPGPFAAKLSKLWVIKQIFDTGKQLYRKQQLLQKEYGDYIRTGPRELTICDPVAMQPILGFKSKTTKAPHYDILEKSVNLNRDKSWHRQRRKIWDNAMKATVSNYAPRVEEFTDQLLARFKAAEGKPVPLLEFMMHYTYDIASDVAFGKPMGFTKGEASDAANWVVTVFEQGIEAMGVVIHLPWLLKALGVMNSVAGPMKHWTNWSINQMDDRLARTDAPQDFMSHLIENTPKSRAGRLLLYGESRLIITAGSDTTATALTFAFVFLATHPEYLHALREEFRSDLANYNCERPRPLVDAVVAETMRLWPPVFFASPRVTPPEGLTINGRFIPGNIVVQMPPFVLHRDPRNFVYPDEFIPERWTTKPELVLNKEAYFPFLTGPYMCAGKVLAQMEMRSVVSRVVDQYDVVMPEGFVAGEYWNGVTEHFTAGPRKQDVKFVRVGT